MAAALVIVLPSRLEEPMSRFDPLAVLVFAAGLLSGCAATAPVPAEPTPQQRLLARLSALVDKEPNHIGAMYTAAKVAAGINEPAQSFRWLDRLEQLGLGDQLEPTDFGALADSPAFRERAERFARAAPPVGTARVWAETRCGDLLPEGTAWDAKRNELLISSGRLRNVVAVSASGACRVVVPAGDARLLAVLGMAIDAASDTLWVASSAAPFMLNARPADDGTARLTQIDLGTGRVRASFALDGGAMLNDLAIAGDGAIYVTESRGGRVVRLARGGTALAPIVAEKTFEGPNGIVALANGDLLVADFHGLWRVTSPSSANPAILRLTTPNRTYLGGIDGMARSGSQIVAIQNLIGRARIWSLTLDADATQVTDARVLLRGHVDFMNPTTGAIAGDRFVFVADPNLQHALPSGEVSKLPAGRSGHRVLEVPLG
jgi:sugar lactone lactonase YvrE